MRLPATNGKYDQARKGQAYPYFMPWLSGDNGTSFFEFKNSELHTVFFQDGPLPVIHRLLPQ
jgi:hypothetical protein